VTFPKEIPSIPVISEQAFCTEKPFCVTTVLFTNSVNIHTAKIVVYLLSGSSGLGILQQDAQTDIAGDNNY